MIHPMPPLSFSVELRARTDKPYAIRKEEYVVVDYTADTDINVEDWEDLEAETREQILLQIAGADPEIAKAGLVPFSIKSWEAREGPGAGDET